MGGNRDFGYDGLQALVQGMTQWDQSCELEVLDIYECTIGYGSECFSI